VVIRVNSQTIKVEFHDPVSCAKSSLLLEMETADEAEAWQDFFKLFDNKIKFRQSALQASTHDCVLFFDPNSRSSCAVCSAVPRDRGLYACYDCSYFLCPDCVPAVSSVTEEVPSPFDAYASLTQSGVGSSVVASACRAFGLREPPIIPSRRLRRQIADWAHFNKGQVAVDIPASSSSSSDSAAAPAARLLPAATALSACGAPVDMCLDAIKAANGSVEQAAITLLSWRPPQQEENKSESVEEKTPSSSLASSAPVSLKPLAYFEVTIESFTSHQSICGVGWSPQGRTERFPGWDNNTMGFHGDSGEVFFDTNAEDFAEPFAQGDVIGCGFDPNTNRAFFTRNGTLIGFYKEDMPRMKLFACIALQAGGEQVRINFGAHPFKYCPDDLYSSASAAKLGFSRFKGSVPVFDDQTKTMSIDVKHEPLLLTKEDDGTFVLSLSDEETSCCYSSEAFAGCVEPRSSGVSKSKPKKSGGKQYPASFTLADASMKDTQAPRAALRADASDLGHPAKKSFVHVLLSTESMLSSVYARSVVLAMLDRMAASVQATHKADKEEEKEEKEVKESKESRDQSSDSVLSSFLAGVEPAFLGRLVRLVVVGRSSSDLDRLRAALLPVLRADLLTSLSNASASSTPTMPSSVAQLLSEVLTQFALALNDVDKATSSFDEQGHMTAASVNDSALLDSAVPNLAVVTWIIELFFELIRSMSAHSAALMPLLFPLPVVNLLFAFLTSKSGIIDSCLPLIQIITNIADLGGVLPPSQVDRLQAVMISTYGEQPPINHLPSAWGGSDSTNNRLHSVAFIALVEFVLAVRRRQAETEGYEVDNKEIEAEKSEETVILEKILNEKKKMEENSQKNEEAKESDEKNQTKEEENSEKKQEENSEKKQENEEKSDENKQDSEENKQEGLSAEDQEALDALALFGAADALASSFDDDENDDDETPTAPTTSEGDPVWFMNLIDLGRAARWLLASSSQRVPAFLRRVITAHINTTSAKFVPALVSASDKAAMTATEIKEAEKRELLLRVSAFSHAADCELMAFANHNKARGEQAMHQLDKHMPNCMPLAPHSPSVAQVRFDVLQHVHNLVLKALPLVPLQRSDDESWLARTVRSLKGVLVASDINELVNCALSATVSKSHRENDVQLNMFDSTALFDQKRTDFKLRASVFGQLLHHFAALDSKKRVDDLSPHPHQKAFNVIMLGLNAQDAGGPYREVLEVMCRELMSPVLPLFVLCPNGKTNSGENRDKFVPRPLPASDASRDLIVRAYEFLGQMLGMAFRTKAALSLRLPSIVWKHLVREQITQDDVRSIDLLSFQIISDIQALEQKAGLTPDVFDSVMADMKFVVYASDGKAYPLVPGGEEMSITWNTRKQFTEALVKYRLNEFSVQCEAIRRGMATVVPMALVSLMPWSQLEQRIAGSSVDVDMLKKHTNYRGCSESDEHIKFFWQMLRERFDEEQRARFIQFVWGRSRLPSSDEDFNDDFRIENYHGPRGSSSSDDDLFPLAHTCFFSVEMPRYSNLDVMTERVIYAMMNTGAIDADSSRQHAAIVSALDDADGGASLFV